MRLFYKTLSYGVVHFTVATAVAYLITGNWAMALGIGIIEPLVQTCVIAVHDYFWERKLPKVEEAFSGCHKHH